MKKYNEEHEWVTVEGNVASVGVSKFAVEQLGDITFVELPEVDDEVEMAASVAFVESVKAASDIYTPVSGKVVEINEDLLDEPDVLNEGAEDIFIFKIELSNTDELNSLMTAEEYATFLESL